MPKRPDPTKKVSTKSTEDNVIPTQTYLSQLEASERYDKTVDHIRLRLPKGWKERLQEYVNNTVDENGDLKYSSKGRGSVNKMIQDLIMKETGWSEE